ncbi:MAG: DUF1232 domain-containing protein [Victivallales bacterium]|nr:DUF1232 domain-containing protein [Victivallales bacterium]MBR4613270.1 DUF1232 domain-containing protein [Kiritimatiellia bacterium]
MKQEFHPTGNDNTRHREESTMNQSNEESRAHSICEEVKRLLAEFFSQLKLAAGFLMDYVNGNYREGPWTAIASLGFAAAYLLYPLDAIPDSLFGIGFLDDMAVLALFFKAFSCELQTYADWEKHQKEQREQVGQGDSGSQAE